jgi:hypothetical protein
VCGCEAIVKIDGMLAKHKLCDVTCPGSGHEPLPATGLLEIEFREAVDAFNATPAGLPRERDRFWTPKPLLLELGERLYYAKLATLGPEERKVVEAEWAFVRNVLGGDGWTGIRRLLWEADFFQNYGHCRVCGKEVTTEQYAWARKKIEKPVCSAECSRLEVKSRYACCERAEFTACSCMYSFWCPEHGEHHIGTHD